MTPRSLYQADWDRLRTEYRRYLFAVLSIVPVLLGAFFLPYHWQSAMVWGFVLWVFFTQLFGLRLLFFRCPRCQEFYFQKTWFSNATAFLWQRRCAHCSLAKWSLPDTADTES